MQNMLPYDAVSYDLYNILRHTSLNSDFLVNTMHADALAPKFARASAGMILAV